MALFVLIISLILIFHGFITLLWMRYAWEDPDYTGQHRSPNKFIAPKLSFTALIPAKHEEAVIEDTLLAIKRINYPENLKQIIVICRKEDVGTIEKAAQTIVSNDISNARVVAFQSDPTNKPHALNIGLGRASNEVIAVFDAEDEPHADIFNIINTLMVTKNVDVVQSGVQLMNYLSKWFSALNVMEYYLWFKSGLHCFLHLGGVTPLGGNTIFIKKTWLEKINGWDENCLTEDADLGIRLAQIGANIDVIYDEIHVTREETPTSVSSFIKQRSRWNQGYFQVLLKGDWLKFSHLKQRIVSLYILCSPLMQILFISYLPFGLWIAFNYKLPVVISLISFLPFYLFAIQLLLNIVGLYEFTKAYKLKHPIWLPLKVAFSFLPYQLMLIAATIRSIYRLIRHSNTWEKTYHANNHRDMSLSYNMARNR